MSRLISSSVFLPLFSFGLGAAAASTRGRLGSGGFGGVTGAGVPELDGVEFSLLLRAKSRLIRLLADIGGTDETDRVGTVSGVVEDGGRGCSGSS